MEVISTYTRQQAIADHVLIDIKAPLFNGTDHTLQKLLGHNHSICVTDTLLNEMLNYCDEEISIEDHLKTLASTMIQKVEEMREKKIERSENTLLFNFGIVATKASGVLKVKSVTHIEPNFLNVTHAKCITFMMETES